MRKSALVLSGGSIKGAFQAGAIAKVLAAGIRPCGIFGISVGSLNGAFLAERAGRIGLPEDQIPWPEIGEELGQFWLQEITSFSRLGRQRSRVKLLWQLCWSRFNGLIDTANLRRLVYDTLDECFLKNSPVRFQAGSVNVADGRLIQADASYPNLLDYVIASTAIPVVMPVSIIGDQPLVDGGIRDVAPLAPAIDGGADDIVCILCQPADMTGAKVSLGKLEEFAERVMEIVVNETVNNDLQRAQEINEHCPEDGSLVADGPYKGYRRVSLTVIRPPASLNVALTDFTVNDIKRLYEDGRAAARKALAEGTD